MIILEFNIEGSTKPLKISAYTYVSHIESECGTKCYIELINGNKFIALHSDQEVMGKLIPIKKAREFNKPNYNQGQPARRPNIQNRYSKPPYRSQNNDYRS